MSERLLLLLCLVLSVGLAPRAFAMNDSCTGLSFSRRSPGAAPSLARCLEDAAAPDASIRQPADPASKLPVVVAHPLEPTISFPVSPSETPSVMRFDGHRKMLLSSALRFYRFDSEHGTFVLSSEVQRIDATPITPALYEQAWDLALAQYVEIDAGAREPEGSTEASATASGVANSEAEIWREYEQHQQRMAWDAAASSAIVLVFVVLTVVLVVRSRRAEATRRVVMHQQFDAERVRAANEYRAQCEAQARQRAADEAERAAKREAIAREEAARSRMQADIRKKEQLLAAIQQRVKRNLTVIGGDE